MPLWWIVVWLIMPCPLIIWINKKEPLQTFLGKISFQFLWLEKFFLLFISFFTFAFVHIICTWKILQNDLLYLIKILFNTNRAYYACRIVLTIFFTCLNKNYNFINKTTQICYHCLTCAHQLRSPSQLEIPRPTPSYKDKICMRISCFWHQVSI